MARSLTLSLLLVLSAHTAHAEMLTAPTYGCLKAETFAQAWQEARVGTSTEERGRRMEIALDQPARRCIRLTRGPVDLLSAPTQVQGHVYVLVHVLDRPHRGALVWVLTQFIE